MANPKHLEILKKGVEVWNEWRKNNPDIKPNLRKANLLRANLSDADLSRANLFGANLWRADLSGANIWRANLNEAYLWRADLSGANLFGANLNEADLSRTDLRRADLSGVNLEGAKNLTIEQLSKVKTLYQAKLDSDLENQIKEKCRHFLEEPEWLKEEEKKKN
jgi:uncharacterized protein YjbI with pentapeptide repeats